MNINKVFLNATWQLHKAPSKKATKLPLPSGYPLQLYALLTHFCLNPVLFEYPRSVMQSMLWMKRGRTTTTKVEMIAEDYLALAVFIFCQYIVV